MSSYRIVLVLALVAACIVAARTSGGDTASSWQLFKSKHGKVYKDPFEDSMRQALYQRRVKLNAEFNTKEAGFTLGENHMSDWTSQELARLTARKSKQEGLSGEAEKTHNKGPSMEEYLQQSNQRIYTELPKEVDWRKVPDRVSSVKTQGLCTAGWAFAAVGAMEGQQVAKNFTQKLVDLSAQLLIDCADSGDCEGGQPLNAIAMMMYLGAGDEDSYPYVGYDQNCRESSRVIMRNTGFNVTRYANETDLKMYVANVGPVAVGFDADTSTFYNYKSGIYQDTTCRFSLNALNHALLVVGYGSDATHGDYWIVKNSWGKSWGDKGFALVARNRGNMCGIATEGVVPTFEDPNNRIQ